MINRMNWAKLLVIALFLIPTVSKSQKVCSEALSEAENMYDMGRLYEISELLHDCIENGFTREEKVRAYKLLSIVNLYLDQFAEADQTYLALLKLNPEYQPNPLIDPAELIYLHDQFNTTIYGLHDRYRGISNERRILFMNPEDMAERGIRPLAPVDITGRAGLLTLRRTTTAARFLSRVPA